MFNFFCSTLYLWDSLTLLRVIIVSFHHCIVFNFVDILQFIYPFHWWIFGLFPVWPITNMYCWHLPFGERVHVCASYLFILAGWGLSCGMEGLHCGMQSVWQCTGSWAHGLSSSGTPSRLVDAPPLLPLAYEVLVPQPGIIPLSPALEGNSSPLDHQGSLTYVLLVCYS